MIFLKTRGNSKLYSQSDSLVRVIEINLSSDFFFFKQRNARSTTQHVLSLLCDIFTCYFDTLYSVRVYTKEAETFTLHDGDNRDCSEEYILKRYLRHISQKCNYVRLT